MTHDADNVYVWFLVGPRGRIIAAGEADTVPDDLVVDLRNKLERHGCDPVPGSSYAVDYWMGRRLVGSVALPSSEVFA